MTAIAWATLGLILSTVGILAGALFTAIGHSDTLRSELGARIDHQTGELGARIDHQTGELGARIDNLASELRSEIRGLREENNSRFAGLHEDVRELRASIAS
jgi:hypothetical protein